MGLLKDARTLGRERYESFAKPIRRAYRYQRVNFIKRNRESSVLALLVVPGLLLVFVLLAPTIAPRISVSLLGIFGLGVFIWAAYLVWPVVLFQSRGFSIDKEMHLFITRMGVLSTSEASRRELLEVLGRMREYGAIATEVEKIHTLVANWKVSLEKAARLTAQDCPSEMFSDFLLRLAHAVETGESAEEFYQNEQIVVMDQYRAKYESGLRGVEVVKELFVALTSSLLFIMTVITITPFITKADISSSLGLAILFFFMFEVSVLWLVRAIVPGESLWHRLPIKTKANSEVRRRFRAGIAFSVGLFFILAPLNVLMEAADRGVPYGGIDLRSPAGPLGPGIPWEIIISLALIPLTFPSVYIALREADIRRRDEMYPTFIRSLGAAVGAKGRAITLPLKRLRLHDFGPLTPNIEDLYRRLSIRVDTKRAWDYFGAESLSELISKFSEMYVEGSRIGGDTRRISRIVSENFLKVLGLRKHRFESAATFVYTLYGLTVAVAFVLYFMLFVVEAFHTSFARLFNSEGLRVLFESPPEGGLGFLASLRNPPFNFGIFRAASFAVIVGHAAVSAALSRILSGGRIEGGISPFVGMVWTGTITAMIVTFAVRTGGLFGAGP